MSNDSEVRGELRMAGHHFCPHCNHYHDCNKPGGAGCFGAVLVFILIALMMPAVVGSVDAWVAEACQKWPNWADGCKATTRVMVNDDLNRRVKKLEEALPKSAGE